MDGCPRFAKAYLGRKRRGDSPTIALFRIKLRERIR
jgi:hypothetical protein